MVANITDPFIPQYIDTPSAGRKGTWLLCVEKRKSDCYTGMGNVRVYRPEEPAFAGCLCAVAAICGTCGSVSLLCSGRFKFFVCTFEHNKIS